MALAREEKEMKKALLIAALIAFVISAGFLGYYFGAKDNLAQRMAEFASYHYSTVHQLINDYRKQRGLAELKEDAKMCELAQERAFEVSLNWSHDGYISRRPILFSVYCPGCLRTGENLARSFLSPEEVVKAWINSPTHKANLDGDYNIGCVRFRVVGTEVFIASMFAKR